MGTLKVEKTEIKVLPCLCGETKFQVSFPDNHLLSEPSPIKLLTCDRCGLIRTHPRPLVQMTSADELYQDEDYFQSAREIEIHWRQMQMSIIKDVQNFKRSGRWLDIGTGPGFLPLMACENGFQAQGIDLNEKVIQEAKSRFNSPVSNQKLEDFSNHSFDIISFNHVLEHFENPFSFLNEVSEKLKPDGIIVAGVPSIHSGPARLFRLINQISPSKGKNWYWQGYQLEQHLWHFSPKTLKENLISDFEILKMETNENMFYGFTTLSGLKYKGLGLLLKFSKILYGGDNLRVIIKPLQK